MKRLTFIEKVVMFGIPSAVVLVVAFNIWLLTQVF